MRRSIGSLKPIARIHHKPEDSITDMSAEGIDNTLQACGSRSATGVLELPDSSPPSKAVTKNVNLEQALADIEEQAGGLVKTTKQVMASFKKIKDAAKVGDLVNLRKLLEEGKEVTLSLGCDFVKTQERLNFDEAGYLEGKAFRQELLTTAQQMGVNLYEHDGYLFSYPVLLRILHKERAVAIDRMRENRLRPSVLVKRLKEVQNKPLRFKPQTFLEMVFTAYSIVVAGRGKHLIGKGTVIPLLELYQLLTLLPWQANEYTRQEFGRDVYLLDKSGTISTKNNHRANFHASTGVRDANKTLTVIAQGGREKTYYGISFVQSG
ncbi:hypothetical protein [Candidatus Nitrospira allomarina]|uniref:Uncharacterized protein n=1 Tax=Candidatus Nitrospira allomarina TaxID=3020900 RepID=A0AA96GA56_9BACT|nr:hypothetical protein [Candidatus Nitrospira allomarina]WNM57756.1 hypothetical protein PP769_17565 [Candidatus Nitrospira allomarina]